MVTPAFNPFKPNRISHSLQSDWSISFVMVVRFYFSFLGLHCLSMSHEKNVRLKSFNDNILIYV